MVAIVAPPFPPANFRATSVKYYGGAGGSFSKSMQLRWISGRSKVSGANPTSTIPNTASESNWNPKPTIPIYISTDPTAIKLEDLRELYSLCNLSAHRFPRIDPVSGRSEESMELEKLRIALSHSAVVVSVFCKAIDLGDEDGSTLQGRGLFRDLMERLVPVSPANGLLVGFGRAFSDLGLTSSIHDVMVIPSLRRRGIGRMVVSRIIRMLTSREIYDIAALCSEEERFFFNACGFGDDILSSTTMMYTRSVSDFQNHELVTRAGRKLLLAPPARHPFAS